MRLCPECHSSDRKVLISDYDGIDLSLSLYQCHRCSMLYVDAGEELTQAWLDDYYQNVYTTADKPYSDQRLNSLADIIREWVKVAGSVLDIGGMDGELRGRIIGRGLACDVEGVIPERNGKQYAAVVLSHTLEHIYDLPIMAMRIRERMLPDALLFIECPIWLGENVESPHSYDYHWQHINKFTIAGVERILMGNGFSILASSQIVDYLEYHCGRFIAK